MGFKSKHEKRAYRQRRKAMLLALMGGACERCGKSYHPDVLCFHHRDPDKKETQLGQAFIADNAWEDVLAAAEDTHLLCLNCHAEVHAFKDFRYFKFPEKYLPETDELDAGPPEVLESAIGFYVHEPPDYDGAYVDGTKR